MWKFVPVAIAAMACLVIYQAITHPNAMERCQMRWPGHEVHITKIGSHRICMVNVRGKFYPEHNVKVNP